MTVTGEGLIQGVYISGPGTLQVAEKGAKVRAIVPNVDILFFESPEVLLHFRYLVSDSALSEVRWRNWGIGYFFSSVVVLTVCTRLCKSVVIMTGTELHSIQYSHKLPKSYNWKVNII